MNNTLSGPSKVEVPGQPVSMKKWLLEQGSNVIQNFDPVNQFKLHLCGFAHYADEPSRQVELHHYCSVLNDDVTQCAVFDGEGSDARLIGVEYVISEKLFDTLDLEEQRLWHSHGYDIKSGSFIAPGLPDPLKKSLYKDLVCTYGKTWVFWQVDKGDPLPLGLPKLMMVATQDGEWDPKLFQTREAMSGRKLKKALEVVEDLPLPKPHGNADVGRLQRARLELQSEVKPR